MDGTYSLKKNSLLVHCVLPFRLPFIENIEYIELRRKIIKVLVQIRVLIRNLRLADQINMPKTKLIVEVNKFHAKTNSQIKVKRTYTGE